MKAKHTEQGSVIDESKRFQPRDGGENFKQDLENHEEKLKGLATSLPDSVASKDEIIAEVNSVFTWINRSMNPERVRATA